MSVTEPLKLFLAQAANASSVVYELPLSSGPGSDANVRDYQVSYYGTWDTSSLILEWSPDGGTTWITVMTAVTATGQQIVRLARGSIRATLSSVGAGTLVSVSIDG